MKLYYNSLSFLLLIFLLGNISIFAQSRQYKVEFMGDSVGLIKTSKTLLENGNSSYYFESKAKAVLFFIQTKTEAKSKLIFDNNMQLLNGYLIRKKNNDKQEIHYQWTGSKYTITDNEKALEINKAIGFCTMLFFFKEPLNIKKVFVERLNSFVEIEKIGTHQYLTKVDGGTNLYSYKNGILTELKSSKGVTIYMKLLDN